MSLKDGETKEVKGSGAKPYVIKNIGGVYSCTCASWRNMGGPIDKRVCKHVRKIIGDEAATAYLGKPLPAPVSEVSKTAPSLLLANIWTPDVDPTGWLMSEKLDGVRGYWDGKNFISRLGNIYHAPEWFKKGLPTDMPLDGELWLDRKQFQKTISIVRRMDAGKQWEDIVFMVFDAPSVNDAFEYRFIKARAALLKGKAKYAQMLDHVICKNKQHLTSELARVEALGGEGLMLRNAQSMYEPGRSSTLLKVKSFKDDEAEVIGHEPGKGKHKGRLGALLVKLASGVEFSVGTGFSDAERENPPPIGSMITFRYQELSDDKVPRFPSYVGIREGY